jgi:hypothetical protein
MASESSFKASDIVNHFKQLKAITSEKWWSNYVTFEWSRIRLGKNSTKWITLRYTSDLSIKPRRLIVNIRNEIHSGQIMPSLPEDVVELKAKFPEARIELRTMKPSLQFQKWSKQVPTQEDRISPVFDENGIQIVPGDEYLSIYYQLASYIDEIFKYEMKQRTERATFMMVYLSQNKTASVKEIKEAVGHINECDTIMRDDDANTIRDKYPDKYVELMKGILTVSSTKVGTIIQERISDKAPKNKGAKLPNPMTRITMPFDLKPAKPGMSPSITVLDKSKPFKINGRKGYENATYEGKIIDLNNVHAFIPSRSIIDGIINMDSVCFSQLGISLPVKASMIVVQQPIKRENNVISMCNDIYGDDFDDDDETNESVTVESVISENPSSSNSIKINDKIVNDSLLNDLSV